MTRLFIGVGFEAQSPVIQSTAELQTFRTQDL